MQMFDSQLEGDLIVPQIQEASTSAIKFDEDNQIGMQSLVKLEENGVDEGFIKDDDVGQIEEDMEVPHPVEGVRNDIQNLQEYHYDYDMKKWNCDIGSCGRKYTKKVDLELHRLRAHGLTEAVVGAKRGRQPNDPIRGPLRKRDHTQVLLHRAGDVEFLLEQQIRQGRIRWRKQAQKFVERLAMHTPDITEEQKMEYVKNYVEQRESAYRAEREIRIAKAKAGIKERFGHYDSDDERC